MVYFILNAYYLFILILIGNWLHVGFGSQGALPLKITSQMKSRESAIVVSDFDTVSPKGSRLLALLFLVIGSGASKMHTNKNQTNNITFIIA